VGVLNQSLEESKGPRESSFIFRCTSLKWQASCETDFLKGYLKTLLKTSLAPSRQLPWVLLFLIPHHDQIGTKALVVIAQPSTPRGFHFRHPALQ
jgi:hypothetical protein